MRLAARIEIPQRGQINKQQIKQAINKLRNGRLNPNDNITRIIKLPPAIPHEQMEAYLEFIRQCHKYYLSEEQILYLLLLVCAEKNNIPNA